MSGRRWGNNSISKVTLSSPTPSSSSTAPPPCVQDLWSVGCGAIHTDLLVETLFNEGIHAVLDVRLLDHSQKRPWLHADVLEKKCMEYGIIYKWVGRASFELQAWAQSVFDQVCLVAPELRNKSRGPREVRVCLLGLREDPQEDGMIDLAVELRRVAGWNVVHFRHAEELFEGKFHFTRESNDMAQTYWKNVRKYIADAQSELTHLKHTCWNRRASTISWRDWRINRAWPGRQDRPILIKLPWDTYVYYDPAFLKEDKVRSLHQKVTPGALDFDQPRRRVRNPDASWTEFTEHAKECWLCNDYDLPDHRRACEPKKFVGQRLPTWAVELMMKVKSDLNVHFNSILCSWEPAGPHPKDGPHSFSTHRGWTRDSPTIGLLAIGGERSFHLHGIPYLHTDPEYAEEVDQTASIDIPLSEGALVLIRGPLQGKWLYGQPRDESWQDERTFLMFQLSTDPSFHKKKTEKELSDQTTTEDSHQQSSKEEFLTKVLGCTEEEVSKLTANEPTNSSARWKRQSVV